jgi:hypothetical protein
MDEIQNWIFLMGSDEAIGLSQQFSKIECDSEVQVNQKPFD